MMIEMISQPEDFRQWFGRFATTPRHELDIAPAEPPYAEEEIVDALEGGEMLTRLSGLRVLHIAMTFLSIVNSWSQPNLRLWMRCAAIPCWVRMS